MTTEDPWAENATTTPEGDEELSFEGEFGDSVNPEEAVGQALPVGTKLPGFPRMKQLYGHLLIVQPLAYDPAAKTFAARNGQAGAQTEEVFRAKVVVLRGAPITVDEIEKQEDGSWKKTGEKVTPEFPVAFYNMNINQGRLIGQLKKKFDTEAGQPKDGGKWLGTLRRSANPTLPAKLRNLPYPEQYDACDKMFDEWRASVADGNDTEAPKFSPMIANMQPGDSALAMDFIRAERAERKARANG